ncbi:D-alanyl-D-alanine carboxypeptidase [Paracoccus caeni]|uniref:D-alanyl-D-alanine carboxypeptidase n=1 Tax=Paracoccus caeni TaxID=657651 RepID=A0A934W070_9RHOB|nr:D-alanyl-D-alanine carboxypeptidase [Paracoccus caeni]MBK4215519.1 D-alanyl-D-alanine carboxypeptidase [Paracoccus caeni]
MSRIDRRGFLTGLALAGLVPSQVLAQGLDRRPPGKPALDAARLIGAAGLPGDVAYALTDTSDGHLLQGGRADEPVPPASTLKAVTALYALSHLGAGHRFRTRVIRAGDMIVLAGGGDPELSTDDLATLADDLVAAGVTSPARFAVWGGALPRIEEIAPGQADHLAYNPALSGMVLNFNRVHLGWRRANGAVQMSLEARAARNSPRAYSVTAAATDQADLFAYRDEGDRESWTMSRRAAGGAGSRWLPIRKPELYAGDVFQTLCRARGLVLPTPEVIETLPEGVELAGLDSKPLVEILRGLLKYSTNLTAELVGLHASGAPDLAQSARRMQAWLVVQGQGIGFTLADHSGLSPDSRVTARGMARLLAGPGLAAGLPGILKQNPLDEDLGTDPSSAGQVAAKTGTLNFVSNLAGYVRGRNGVQRSFAVLCMDPPRHQATSGQELPSGVLGWTRDAKRLQRVILNSWGRA